MKTVGPVSLKRVGKQDRERRVLLGLVEHYIQTGKPVGSNSLKDAGFDDLSSATIRNYFAHLEETGFLTQSHSSGGRIPTNLAYRAYAEENLASETKEVDDNLFEEFQDFDSREMALFLQKGAESLSQVTQCAVFLSAPRFDHDYVIDVKLVPIDTTRCLCVLITDFGMIKTEILYLPEKLSPNAIKRIESYFHWRLTGTGYPEHLEPEEEALGQRFYSELMLRFIVSYSYFADEDIYRTGFSRLLPYPDFQDAKALASALSLFENVQAMRLILKECKAHDRLIYWIGDDLSHLIAELNCSILSIPYFINYQAIGSVALLGPTRLPYRKLFQILRLYSDGISEAITRNIYKFKISFRQPDSGKLYLQREDARLIGQSSVNLLEDKRA